MSEQVPLYAQSAQPWRYRRGYSAWLKESPVNRKILATVLKVAVSLGIVAYLVWDASKTKDGVNVFENLLQQPKHWAVLAAALGVSAAGIVLTFVRWWVLLRALGVPSRLGDTIRVGFWGFLFNLAPLGVVGGDLVKVVMLGREHRNKRASVVASVIVDRMIGLYILFVVATVAILVTSFWRYQIDDIGRICNGVFLVTGLGAVGIIIVMALDAAVGRWLRLLHHIPRVGTPIAHLLEDLLLYRHRLGALLTASLITVAANICSSVSFYLIARGLPGEAPPLGIHFVIVPLSISSGVVPLPMGPLEFVLEFFYMRLPMCGSIAKGQGLLVALVNRLNGIFVALAGVVLYVRSRRELSEAIHASQAEPEN